MHENTNRFKLNYKIWLETSNNTGVLGDGKWQLLKAIDETGSLKLAIEKMGYSYRKTWDSLKKIEQILGCPVINPCRGGCDGGNTTLTDNGKKIVHAFDSFHEEFDKIAQDAFQKMLCKLEL